MKTIEERHRFPAWELTPREQARAYKVSAKEALCQHKIVSTGHVFGDRYSGECRLCGKHFLSGYRPDEWLFEHEERGAGAKLP